MNADQGLRRKAHFVGTKIRALRKRNGLTLEDLSMRCLQADPKAGPSISYLSMIENGRRVPSVQLLQIIADIFQKDVTWFMDETLDSKALDTAPETAPVAGMPFEPGFLFQEALLQTAIPELLSQTGTTGRQFAHLLIRARQEASNNRFPDLERAAESVGNKTFPLGVDDLLSLARRTGLDIQWFDRPAFNERRVADGPKKTIVRSFFEAPNTLYLNKALEAMPARLKFDIANHIGHMVLHGGDGARSPQLSGGRADSRDPDADVANVDAKDVLYAWRDFECSYFAAALLAPKTPFRQFLAKQAYAIDAGDAVELTTALTMRRMPSVSPYAHWHYFDAYPPGRLRAVYRGNGIPLPWGNLTALTDPCRHWAVFRLLNARSTKPSSQISVLRNGNDSRLYCCQSIRSRDAAGNPYVLCVGIDLAPALAAQGIDARDTIDAIESACNRNGGSAALPAQPRKQLETVGRILNIGWIAEGARDDATIICPRSHNCPRDNHCLGTPPQRRRAQIDDIRSALIGSGD
jgi:transcriptional regulator with XRE-family HTH domain